MSERRFFRAAFLATMVLVTVSGRLGAQAIQRSMYVSVLNEAGAPVSDLGPSDLVVREDNVAREVLRVAAADEPMQIEVLVDNSAAAEPYVGDIRRAVAAFTSALVKPRDIGHRNEVGLVATGDRPTILTPSTFDPAELKKGADRIFARSGSGNYLLDGILEVCRGFRARAAARPVILAITTEGTEFSPAGSEPVLKALSDAGAAFYVVVVGPNVTDTSDEGRSRSVVLDRGPTSTGGRFVHILMASALETTLLQMAEELTHQYRVTFARPQSLIPPERTTVGVTRPGLTARGTLIREQGRP